jgi:hypothetical protein
LFSFFLLSCLAGWVLFHHLHSSQSCEFLTFSCCIIELYYFHWVLFIIYLFIDNSILIFVSSVWLHRKNIVHSLWKASSKNV